MEVKHYFQVVTKWWWLAVASVLVATAASYVSLQHTPRIYQATTTVQVGQATEQENPSYADFTISQQLAQTYLNMVSRRPILEGAALALGLPYVPWSGNVSARLVGGTQLLEITVRDTDPEIARAIADEIAQQLILQSPNRIAEDEERQAFVHEQLKKLEDSIRTTGEEIVAEQEKLDAASSARAIQQYQSNITAMQQKLANYQSTYASLLQSVEGRTNYISVFESAVASTQPISPRVGQTLMLAAAIGLALALGGAFLIEFLDDTIKTPEDVTRAVHLPTVGAIVRMNGKTGDTRLVPLHQPLSPAAEAYRALRTNIQISSVDKPIHTLVVTSANPLEGKSTTVANMSVVMAQAGKSVIVVDADLRRSSIHKIFQMANREGLTNALIESEPSAEVWLQETKVEKLRVLTSGPLPPNPSELLGSQKMVRLVEQLRKTAEIVIFDAPPLLSVTDAVILALEADGVLLVVEAGRTRRTAIRDAVDQLGRVGAKVLGVVLNGVPPRQTMGYHYGYYEKGRVKPGRAHLPWLGRRHSQPPPP